MKFLTAIVLTSLALAFGSVGIVSAQEAVAQEKQSEEGKLTEDSLETMLKGMGHTPRVAKEGKHTFFYIKVTQENITYEVLLVLSSNKEKLWMHTSLVDFPKDGKVSPDRLLKFVELNRKIGPCFFAKSGNALYIDQAVDNRSMTVATLRTAIEYLATAAHSTKEYWLDIDWAQPIGSSEKEKDKK